MSFWVQAKHVNEELQRDLIARHSGIYVICLSRGSTVEPVYVGEAKDIWKRLESHRQGLQNLKRTFLREPLLRTLDRDPSGRTWLQAICDYRGATPEGERLSVFAVTKFGDSERETLNREAADFWNRLGIFALMGITDRSQRTSLEATLQELFTRGLTQNKQNPLGLPRVHIHQAPKSLFLGKRQGVVTPSFDASTLPEPLRAFLKHPIPDHGKAA